VKKRLFTDSDVMPTDSLLRKHLGKAIEHYQRVVQTSGAFRKIWQWSRGNGWILKVDDTRKALYYLIPFVDGIEVSLTVRDAERQAFMENDALAALVPQMQAATKYSEGYALRFEVEDAKACESVSTFIKELIKIRTS
jgi:hypothetical protein